MQNKRAGCRPFVRYLYQLKRAVLPMVFSPIPPPTTRRTILSFSALQGESIGTTDSSSMTGSVLNLEGALKRPRRTLLWGLVMSSIWSSVGSAESSTDPQLELDSKRESGEGAGELTLFSEQWASAYGEGELGCEQARGSYTWRPYGFGSNMNSECKSPSRALQQYMVYWAGTTVNPATAKRSWSSRVHVSTSECFLHHVRVDSGTCQNQAFFRHEVGLTTTRNCSPTQILNYSIFFSIFWGG